MNDTFMKEKPVLPLILSMSLPMVLSMLVNSLYNIVDSFFVAQISEEAMTALSLVYPVQNFINAVGIGFGVGINAVIAFYLGAGDYEKADQSATQGLVLAVIHGVVMTVCCIAVMPVFLRMFTASEAVIALGVRYSVVAFAFTLIVTVSMAFEKLFQAVGNMKTTMISLMCGCITNIVLDPVLIFGYGPFPEMGIEGAALATGIGQALTLAIYLVVYLARPIRVHIRRQYVLPGKKMVVKLYSIGIPATLNLALPSLLISALNAILAAYSEVYILVLGIYYKLQTFIYLPANGIVQGMRPLIGYNYGAGESKRVSQIYQIVLCMSGIIMVLGTVICLLIPGQLMGLFTHTEATIQAGETALRIIGAGFIVSAVSVTSSGALEGLGKGTPSLLISLCRYGGDHRGHFPCHLPQGNRKTCDGGSETVNAVLTPLSRINSCFSKMSSYRIMETVTNERRHYDGNKKIHQEFSVCQVEDNLDSEYSFIGKTDEEKSLVCLTSEVPPNVIRCDDGWKALRIQGVLEFSLIGILSKIAAILADHNIPIFAVSTYNTDYLLVKKEDYEKAIQALEAAGYKIIE